MKARGRAYPQVCPPVPGNLFEIYRYCLPPPLALRCAQVSPLRSARARLRACCSPFGLAVCPAHDQRMRIKRIENGENSPSGGDTAFQGSIHSFVVFPVVYSISSGSIYPSAHFFSLTQMSFPDLPGGNRVVSPYYPSRCLRVLFRTALPVERGIEWRSKALSPVRLQLSRGLLNLVSLLFPLHQSKGVPDGSFFLVLCHT